MHAVIIIGLDLAKNTFQLRGTTSDGTVIYRPFLDLEGAEILKYRVADSDGPYTEAWATVDVVGV